ncbi:SRPBCC family protein [Dickeya oryzae]|uniref:SRPBCC family protein n=1 Tax=Dickeya oryzae TaxID=1240404 RepID=A0ABS5BHJ7_9GAMM|nr:MULTISPECIES: SRPBCC family protein [Dickeya]MBP2859938.1 SRPBCC family protein [Dickeya oryzae]MCO7255680.1 SRPBCC family protein [Dickeya oryzae]QIZ48138.1 SRPBCC family protein [Dickeya zeae]
MPSTFPRRPGMMDNHADQLSSSLIIRQSADVLFDLWRNPETLPVLMNHVAHIDIINHTDSLWRMKAPFGQYIEWRARIEDEQPGQFIYWRSLPGAKIPNEGCLVFRPIPNSENTEVTLSIRFDPPGGFLGKALSQVFQLLPKEMLHKTLLRFKQMAEHPGPTTSSNQNV